MIPSPYTANSLVDLVIQFEKGVAEHIGASAYSQARGFVQGRLTRGETPGFDAARLSPGEAQLRLRFPLLRWNRPAPASRPTAVPLHGVLAARPSTPATGRAVAVAHPGLS